MSTNWLPSEPRGEQQPQVLSRPPFSTEEWGDHAVELAASVGLHLDPWQQLSLRVILAEREDRRWAAFETGELVARQNGKGGIIEALGLTGLFVLNERLILYSAHEFKTAQEHFLRMMELIENAPSLRRKCKPPRTSHGEEQFETLSGNRLRFVARSRKSQRGFTGDRLLIDEAQELSLSAIGAALPTLRTRDNPQVNYFGTVPEHANDSEHWEQLRDRGHAGDDPSLAWLEWAAKSDDLDDRENWRAANPALGIRVREEAIERERAALSEDGFAREILSIWNRSGTSAVIDPNLWHDLEDLKSEPGRQVSFAVDMPPNRSHASIVAAGEREDGLWHVELVPSAIVDGEPKYLDGTGWVTGRLVELVEKWDGDVAVDPSSPAGSLIPELQEAGIEPVLVSGREMAQACGAFYDAVTDRRVRHLGQPKLNVSVDAGRKKPYSDAWVWHRKDTSSDISPLVAATLAYHVARKPSKRRKKTGRAAFV